MHEAIPIRSTVCEWTYLYEWRNLYEVPYKNEVIYNVVLYYMNKLDCIKLPLWMIKIYNISYTTESTK